MPLPEKLSNIVTLRLTWIEPEEECYSLYRLRDGTLEALEDESGLRVEIFDESDPDEEVEIALLETPTGLQMNFDYDDDAVSLSLQPYGSGATVLYVHESPQHLIYLKIERRV